MIDKWKILSKEEKAKIDAYLEWLKSFQEISKLIKKLVGVIYNYSKDRQIVTKILTENCNPHLSLKEIKRNSPTLIEN